MVKRGIGRGRLPVRHSRSRPGNVPPPVTPHYVVGMPTSPLVLTGRSLSIADVVTTARNTATRLALDPHALIGLGESRARVDRAIATRRDDLRDQHRLRQAGQRANRGRSAGPVAGQPDPESCGRGRSPLPDGRGPRGRCCSAPMSCSGPPAGSARHWCRRWWRCSMPASSRWCRSREVWGPAATSLR